MKLYIKDQNVYWLDEPLIGADAEYPLNPTQEDILRNGGTAEFKDGTIVIIPKAPEIYEAVTTVITKREFLDRVFPEEYAAIKEAANTNHLVDYFWQKFLVSEYIDISHSDTVAGLNLMEQAGLLSVGRAKEILR